MSALPPKIEDALERAFRKHEAESFATDAALVAAVLIKQHGDDAARVLQLALKIARETREDVDPNAAGDAVFKDQEQWP